MIWKVAAGTGVASIYAGTGAKGYTGDNDLAVDATFNSPQGLGIDGQDNLYVLDLGNYVIRKIASKTGIVTTVAGNGQRVTTVYGSLPNNVLATSVPLFLYSNGQIAVNAGGDVYFPDSGDGVIRKVTGDSDLITTYAGVLGCDFFGDGGPATQAKFCNPSAVTLDNAGNLFIMDSNNWRIREVSASTGIISTIAGNGDRGDSGDGGQQRAPSSQEGTARAAWPWIRRGIFMSSGPPKSV